MLLIVDEDEEFVGPHQMHAEGAAGLPVGFVAVGADPFDVAFALEKFLSPQGGVRLAQGDELSGEVEEFTVFFEEAPVDP